MILEDLKKYAYNCIHDVYVDEYEDYISCQTHKWACKRFLNDLKRSQTDDDCWFYWDEEKAQSIYDWFSLLRHSKGELSGTPIYLNPWQKFAMCQLYGWRRKDNGRRRFKRSFFELARKNSKSQLESGVALYEASVTATSNKEVAEIYTAGTKREQSKIVWEECKLMLRGSPLQTKCSERNFRRETRKGCSHMATDDGQSESKCRRVCNLESDCKRDFKLYTICE